MEISHETLVQKHEEFVRAYFEAHYLTFANWDFMLSLAIHRPILVVNNLSTLYDVYVNKKLKEVEEPLENSDTRIVVETMQFLVQARKDHRNVISAWIDVERFGFDMRLAVRAHRSIVMGN